MACIIAFIAGAFAGVLTMCCMVGAGRESRQEEEELYGSDRKAEGD